MEQYKVTSKHPVLKEGVSIVDDQGQYCHIDGGWMNLKEDLEKGYIKEIQEKEFTKDDILDFAMYYHNDNYPTMTGHFDILDNWLKRRK